MTHYPKLFLLLCSFALAYLCFHLGYFDWLHGIPSGYGYVSVFVGGLLFSFGFTTPFGIAIMAGSAAEVNPFLAAPLAGVGALLSDFLIFEIMHFSVLHDEIHRLRTTRIFMKVERMFHHPSISERMRMTILWCFAGLVIASPLPDELGVTLVSSISDIDGKKFAVLCFLFNTLGILMILLAARAVS
jgi:hypothetical protein